MSINQRKKGQRGERRVIDWLQPIVDAISSEEGVNSVLLQRNTVQSDQGGTDIIGVDWMAAEVKNCAKCNHGDILRWWAQTLEQADTWRRVDGTKRTPVLFYITGGKIRVRIPGVIWHEDCVDAWHAAPIDIDSVNFEIYFTLRMRKELQLRKH